jgi:hypothetical protein
VGGLTGELRNSQSELTFAATNFEDEDEDEKDRIVHRCSSGERVSQNLNKKPQILNHKKLVLLQQVIKIV